MEKTTAYVENKRDIRGDTAKLVGKGISPALRFLRALNAKTVLLADTAKVRQRNERMKVYAKLGLHSGNFGISVQHWNMRAGI